MLQQTYFHICKIDNLPESKVRRWCWPLERARIKPMHTFGLCTISGKHIGGKTISSPCGDRTHTQRNQKPTQMRERAHTQCRSLWCSPLHAHFNGKTVKSRGGDRCPLQSWDVWTQCVVLCVPLVICVVYVFWLR